MKILREFTRNVSVTLPALALTCGCLSPGAWERDLEESAIRIVQSNFEDQKAKYEIVKRNGDEREAASRAGTLADSYLKYHDEANYRIWKEKRDQHLRNCQNAGEK